MNPLRREGGGKGIKERKSLKRGEQAMNCATGNRRVSFSCSSREKDSSQREALARGAELASKGDKDAHIRRKTPDRQGK